jgi:hypothetical protein
MRVLFIGGTGPVGLSSLPHLQAAGHELAVAHTGAHEPDAARDVEHLNGERGELLAPDGPAERWRPDAIIDTFAGGATGAKARGLASSLGGSTPRGSSRSARWTSTATAPTPASTTIRRPSWPTTPCR